MIVPRSTNAVKRYLETQLSPSSIRPETYRIEDRPPEAAPIPLFVTISREAGAGGYVVADALADLLNERHIGQARTPWTVFDRQILAKMVERHDIPEEYMRDVEQKRVPAMQALVEEMFVSRFSTHSLVHMTSRTVLHIANIGNAVIIGRGGNIVTRKLEGGLHVRLVGSPERRLLNLMENRDMSRAEAKALREEEDASRKDYIRRYFQREINDPHFYDLVVDTDKLGFRDTARMLAEAVAIHAKRLTGSAEPV